jgi:phosphohistidine phosphatase SixA
MAKIQDAIFNLGAYRGRIMSRNEQVTSPDRLRCISFASLLLACAMCLADDASAPRRELLTNLRHGGYVILMRHASSPREIPGPAHRNADNQNNERQLDESGVQTAQAMGDALPRLKIPIGQVLSSPTYRALQTVKFAKLGTATTFAELGDGGQSMQADNSGGRAAWLRSRAATLPLDGTNTIIVTHFPNIMEAFGQSAMSLADGEALILKPDGRGGSPIVTRLKIDEWSTLDTAK